MEAIDIFRILCIATGILFLILDFRAYVRQKLTESIGLVWMLFSVILIVLGVSSGALSVSDSHIFLWIFLIAFILICLLFRISMAVSGLILKNQELAMQVSLLNQENERILHELGILTDEKKDIIRD
ncbi:MAG: DUF2304 domain-containing protein [Roseburia sp.]|nr:DUF2304 domain-containing protein [Roseburia sp.]